MRLLGGDEDHDRHANHVPVGRGLNSGAIRFHKVPVSHLNIIDSILETCLSITAISLYDDFNHFLLHVILLRRDRSVFRYAQA